jgi:hypothetical protein
MDKSIARREAKIRNRMSYREYVELAALLVSGPTLGELATWFHRKLDKHHGYGYERNAFFARESLEQFCRDFKAQARVRVSGGQHGAELPLRRVVSKSFPKKTRCLECGSAVETAYAFDGEEADEHVLCASCFAEMLVREQAEICNECGRSVAFGSGWFVNRVPDFNSLEERVKNSKPYPHGGFLCAECDRNSRRTVRSPKVVNSLPPP